MDYIGIFNNFINKKYNEYYFDDKFIDDQFIDGHTITLVDYINRFIFYSDFEEKELVNIHILIERLCDNGYKLSKQDIKYLFGTITIIYMKMFYDDIYCMSVYSTISGIDTKKLFDFELWVLQKIDYRVVIKQEEYNKIIDKYYSNTLFD